MCLACPQMPPWSPEEAWSAWDIYQEALQRAHRAEARALEAEKQIAKEQRYCSVQWNFSVFFQDKSNKLEKEVQRLKCELNREIGFSDTMKEGYQRYLRIARHLTGREMGHVQSMDRKGQLWRVSEHCKTRIEFYLSKAYGEMRAAEGHHQHDAGEL